ncbi:hypothetical protein RI129_011602 [Pyrocoelia pectoralis]|uniref:Microtubule-associated protein Jupiter n=1 Tax=Pyrocoelia pectoralis TaxID=417401 RepID=A0AAN7Z7S0_9COLE
MSSTNVNIGMEGKASSRVLKPPGGAHSDIFGTSENINSKALHCVKQHEKSSIGECFDYKSSPKNKETKQDCNEANGNEENDSKLTTNEMPTIAAARVRVPPGGFSSSLW